MTLIQIDGDVAAARAFSFEELAALDDQVPDVGALVPGREGGAVRLRALLAAAGARASARWVLLESADGFSISVPLAPLGDALVAYRLGDGPLPPKKGGPARLFLPGVERCEPGSAEGVDACAQVKALARIHLAAERPADTHRH